MSTIHISPLPKTLTESELKQEFEKYGEIVKVTIPWAGKYGFVEFQNSDDANKAIKESDKTTLRDVEIKVELAKSDGRKRSRRDRRPRRRSSRYDYSDSDYDYYRSRRSSRRRSFSDDYSDDDYDRRRRRRDSRRRRRDSPPRRARRSSRRDYDSPSD